MIESTETALKTTLTVISFFKKVTKIFEKSPIQKYEEYLNALQDLNSNREILLNKRQEEDKKNTSYVLYFFKIIEIPIEEKALRKKEDELFKQEEIRLNKKIKALEKDPEVQEHLSKQRSLENQ